MTRGILSAFLWVGCAAACTAVDGDRILGSDLARSDTRYASLPPDFVAGFSAVPGSQRILDRKQLSAVARRYGIPVDDLIPLCFERPTELLTEAKLRDALEHALSPGTRLEIVDFSRYPVPHGDLMFSGAALPRPPASTLDAPVVWRGHLKYGTRGTVVVWAKVRVSRLEQWIETTTVIGARQIVEPGQLVVKSGWRFPFAAPALSDPASVAGKQAARSLPAGQVIVPAMLAVPNEIERGDMVDVEIASGGVSLRFTARAETGGHRNDTVLVSCVETGKRYRGRVQQKGKVLISADSNRKASVAGDQRSPLSPADASGSERQGEEEAAGAGIRAGSILR
jgi:flagella basal body P-ring formation protein FlgA